MGTKNAGLAYGVLIGLMTACSSNSLTNCLKIRSLGGVQRNGGDLTGVVFANSICYMLNLAIPRELENNEGNSSIKISELKSLA